MRFEIDVENIRCQGCANSIHKALLAADGIHTVQVDVPKGRIDIDANDELKEFLVETLQGLGYPLRGSVKGIASMKAKARSVVSCAVGRGSS